MRVPRWQVSAGRIKRLRFVLNLTQEEMAREVGVTVSTYNRWENDRAFASRLAVAALHRLASEAGKQL